MENKMQFQFIIKANKKDELKVDEIVRGLKFLAVLNNINLKISIAFYRDKFFDLVEITPKYFDKKKNENFKEVTDFHCAYLTKYVNDEKLDIKLLDIF